MTEGQQRGFIYLSASVRNRRRKGEGETSSAVPLFQHSRILKQDLAEMSKNPPSSVPHSISHSKKYPGIPWRLEKWVTDLQPEENMWKLKELQVRQKRIIGLKKDKVLKMLKSLKRGQILKVINRFGSIQMQNKTIYENKEFIFLFYCTIFMFNMFKKTIYFYS